MYRIKGRYNIYNGEDFNTTNVLDNSICFGLYLQIRILIAHQNATGNTFIMESRKTLSYFNIYCTGHWYFDDAAFSNASARLTLLSILLTVT